jgi:sortase B
MAGSDEESDMNKIKYSATLIVLGSICLGCTYVFGRDLFRWKQDTDRSSEINKVIESTAENKSEQFTHESWIALKQQSDRFVGYMAFPDGFVAQPIVQGTDNTYYLKHALDGSYSEQGTVFVRSEDNTANDTNITLLGHHVEYDSNAMFSPLVKLADQAEYDNHHDFSIWYENQKIDYEILAVFNMSEAQSAEFDFTQRNFYGDADFNRYMNYVSEHNLIHPADTISSSDRFLTIQTCQSYFNDTKVILLAKQIDSNEY